MAKFVAERVKIDLELTTLEEARRALDEGDEPKSILLTIKPQIVLNADCVSSLIREWSALENKNKERKKKEGEEGEEEEKLNPFEVMAIELAMLYDKPKEWWLESFDTNTLNEIMKHVAEQVAGLKKSPKSSKRSSRSGTTG